MASAAVTSNGSAGVAIPADKTGGAQSAVTKDEVAGESTDKRAVLRMTIKDLARAVHLTEDDTAWTMQQLGLVKRRERHVPPTSKVAGVTYGAGTVDASAGGAAVKLVLVRGSEMPLGPAASDALRNGEWTEDVGTLANGHTGAMSSGIDEHIKPGRDVNGNGDGDEVHTERGQEEDEEEDEDEGDPAAHHRHWVFDMSKARIEELCVRYKVTEAPLLLESAVRL